jgi:hypothetical protein
MSKRNTNGFNLTVIRQAKYKKIILKNIVKKVEVGTQLSIKNFKQKYNEEQQFYEALKHCTTTKKALCKALDINIDNACRYKRELEKNGHLVQSINKVLCPFTRYRANLLSTNSNDFESLLKTNQLKLFKND